MKMKSHSVKSFISASNGEITFYILVSNDFKLICSISVLSIPSLLVKQLHLEIHTDQLKELSFKLFLNFGHLDMNFLG